MAPAAAAPPIPRGMHARRATGVALVLAAAAAAGWAHAGSDIDCKAVNGGAMNIELAAMASDTRSATLRSGEILKFTFRAERGASGTLTLLEGPGSPCVLLAGPAGTSASFAAAHDASFRFQFASDAGAAVSFTASCLPDRSAGRAAILRRDQIALGDGAPDALDVAGALDFDTAEPVQGSKAPLGGVAGISVLKQAGGPQMKLQWRSERYAATGPEGPEFDRNASGVEIGVNYKLQPAILIGALAQFDPGGETLFGGQRSLSDHPWVAGPLTTIHFTPGLVFDARAGWGIAESGADDPTGTGQAAQRRLLSARLANKHSFGAWRFTPSISFSHMQQMLQASGPASADAPHVAGRIDVAPELAYRIDMAASSFIEPRAVIGSFWGFDDLAKMAPGVHLEPRLKAEAGVTLGIVDGPKLQASGLLEEGGAATPDVWSGRIQLSVPLK